MKFPARIITLGICLALAIPHARAEFDPLAAPDHESLLQAVRATIPSFVNISYLTKKTLSASGDQWEFEGSLTGTLLEDLYVDISKEILGTPPSVAADSVTPSVPVILQKIHAKREIIEILVKFQVAKSDGHLTLSRLNFEPPLATLGTPSSKYPVNALFHGTSQASAAIRMYQSASSQPKSLAKKEIVASEPAAAEKSAKAVEKLPASETAKKTEEPKTDKKVSLAKLLTACSNGTLYEATLRERDGLHEVILDFGQVERDGDFVTATLREKHSSFQRRNLSGLVRANPKIPQNFELILMGTDSPTPKTSSKNSSQAVQYRTSFILTLDEENNLIGNYESKASYTSQIPSITLPSPLSSNAVHQIRFTRSASRF